VIRVTVIHRGISFISIGSQIVRMIKLTRLKDAIDKVSKEEHYVFWMGEGEPTRF